jgi:hypothetical protein
MLSMNTYKIIDLICDAFIPILIVWVIILLGKLALKKQLKKSLFLFAAFVYGVAIVYGLYFLDKGYHLWGFVRLDYSTHSAFILVLCATLRLLGRNSWLLLSILLTYLFLMLYQHYHSLADILTTLVVVGILSFPPMIYFSRQRLW